MKYMKIMGFIAASLLTAYVGQAHAQKNNTRINVGVYVRGEENLNNLIEGYISKELMGLGNVIVTYSGLDCAIDVVVKNLSNGKDGARSGCALSVTIIDRFDSTPITRVIKELDTLIPEIKAQPAVTGQLEALSQELVSIAISTARIKSYQNSFLYTGSAGRLREVCSRIVTDFNNEYLKEKRTVLQKRITLDD